MSGFTPTNNNAGDSDEAAVDTSGWLPPRLVADPPAPAVPAGEATPGVASGAATPGPGSGAATPRIPSGAVTPRPAEEAHQFGRHLDQGQPSGHRRASGASVSGAVAPMADMGLPLRSVRELEDERTRAQAALDVVKRELAEKSDALTAVSMVRNLATALNNDAVKQFLAALATSVRTGPAVFPDLTDVQKRVLADSNYNGVVALELNARPCDRCIRRVVQRPSHRCIRTPAGCHYCTKLKKKCIFEVS